MNTWALAFCLLLAAGLAHAQESSDSGISSIHKIDIQDSPDPTAANFINLNLDVKRLKVPGSHANVVLRQLDKRVRLEFEGAGLPRGQYAMAVSERCPSGHTMSDVHYKKAWHEMHRFSVSTSYIETEKSTPGAALREGGKLILFGKSLGFFKLSKGSLEVIDCHAIN